MVSSKLLKKIYKKLDSLEAQVEVNQKTLKCEMVLMKSTFERLITNLDIFLGFNSPRNRSPYPENRFPTDASFSPPRRPEAGGSSNPPPPPQPSPPQPQPESPATKEPTPPASPKPSPPKTDVPEESQEKDDEIDDGSK